MNGVRIGRLARLLFGAVAVAVPFFALVWAQSSPVTAQPARVPDASQPEGDYALRWSMQVTATSTATNTPTSTPTDTPTTTTTPTETQTRTPTPTRTPISTPIYVDQYEPNNTIETAYTTAAGLVLPLNTLWPSGDADYFRFFAKAGSAYEILTRDLDPGLDTFMTVYGTNGNVIATNDDFTALSRASKVTISANRDGFFFASVINLSADDTADLTYSLEIKEILGTSTPTAFPTGTRVPTIDDCEPNNTFQSACVLLLETTYNFDFVPVVGTGPDNDFFRIWVKSGLHYTCETFNLSSVNDTNMIMYSGPGFDFGIAGNDDIDTAAGNFGSRVSIHSNYTGWLYVLVGPGPNLNPPYEVSNLYTYSMECTQSQATATPTRVIVPTQPGGTGGTGGVGPTPTPFAFPTFPPTPTAINLPALGTPTPQPIVQILPLPTVTPAGPPQQNFTVDVTVYYDANRNFTPELTEGVMDAAVALSDASTGELLSFGYTNEAGNVRFGPISSTGPLRVIVPFLNFSQLVTEPVSTIQLRVAPRPLPDGIP